MKLGRESEMFSKGIMRTMGAAALSAGILLGGGIVQAQEEVWSDVVAAAKAEGALLVY